MVPFLTTLGKIGSAILPSLFGAGQSVIEARQQRKNIEMQNTANRQLAEYQYNKQLEMWNRQNEYNSPSSQMERFNQAGLNPNLIYGQGNAGNASQLPKYEAPQLSYNYKAPIDLSSALNAYQDFSIKQAQTDNLREQNGILKANRKIREWEASVYPPRPGVEAGEGFEGSRVFELGVPGLKWNILNSQMEAAEYNARIAEAKLSEILLANVLKEKDINWYTWNRIGATAMKGVSAIAKKGLSLGKLGLKSRSGLAPYKGIVNYSPELSRSVTKYYR